TLTSLPVREAPRPGWPGPMPHVSECSLSYRRPSLAHHTRQIGRMARRILKCNRLAEPGLANSHRIGFNRDRAVFDLHGHFLTPHDLGQLLEISLQHDVAGGNGPVRAHAADVGVRFERDCAHRRYVALLYGEVGHIDGIAGGAGSLGDQYGSIRLDGNPDRHAAERIPRLP